MKLAYMAELLSKKTLLRNQNTVKRLQCAKAHKNWKIEQLNKVLWTDESKFEIFRSNRRVSVRQRVGQRVAIPCITPTVKHGGGSVGGGSILPIAKSGISNR